MAAPNCYRIFFFLFVGLLLDPASCARFPFFIFGDSNFDAGNNNYINTTNTYRSNFYPYGETYFRRPTGRFSDGRIMPDFIAEHAKLPFIQPYYQPGNQFDHGANFASSGAGALASTYPPGMTIGFRSQLENFKNMKERMVQKQGQEEAGRRLASAVYLFSIGSNDYLSLYFQNVSSTVFRYVSHSDYVGWVIGNISAVIQEIHGEGGRKFGFVNIAPLDCFPVARVLNPIKIGACNEEFSVLIKLHNEALLQALRGLQAQLPGFKYSHFDLYSSVSETNNNPSKYGFRDVTTSCCGSGPYRGINSCGGKGLYKEYELCDDVSEHLTFDYVHYTEKGHRQWANLMWNGRPNVTGPYNLQSFFIQKH